jgi:hypothetical protein
MKASYKSELFTQQRQHPNVNDQLDGRYAVMELLQDKIRVQQEQTGKGQTVDREADDRQGVSLILKNLKTQLREIPGDGSFEKDSFWRLLAVLC